jgi:hypothetical protein
MILSLTIVWYFSVHAASAQLANFDQSDKSCRDIGHCRTVWDIIWSCLTVISACTWVAIHPNIPKQERGTVRKYVKSVHYFLGALIAPEAIILIAMGERIEALEIARKNKGIIFLFF